MNKGELMKLVYSEDELRAIDSATPMSTWEEFPPIDHVMNYNEQRIFGKIENLFDEGVERGVFTECENCDNGVEYVDESGHCGKPVSDCCGGCGHEKDCEECSGLGVIIN